MKTAERKSALMPNGIPRYIRCYDNGGETFDRYTVVYTGHYRNHRLQDCIYIGMSEYPYQGFGQHGFSNEPIDRPTYGHLGKKISFDQLPEDCKKAVISDYKDIWNL